MPGHSTQLSRLASFLVIILREVQFLVDVIQREVQSLLVVLCQARTFSAGMSSSVSIIYKASNLHAGELSVACLAVNGFTL